ncbi:MAG: DUF456 domain-containing protein [Sporichthyaceae bacterium]|nr:DUF456 domain-containing protein [Sporichthyaceae bacterium]
MGNLFVGVVILIGLLGVVIPVLPGLWPCWLALLIWALFESSVAGWVVFGIATGLMVLSQIVKFVVPGKRMRDAGVPWRSMAVGGILGIVGFFLIPVVGLFLGFPLGVYLAERLRLGDHDRARASTVHAVKAMGLSILIELAAGLLMAVTWGIALVVA